MNIENEKLDENIGAQAADAIDALNEAANDVAAAEEIETLDEVANDAPTEEVVIEEEPEGTKFADLGISHELLKAITDMGFENPMPIQEMVIPHLIEKEGDVIGLAQTGTGKTAAFGLPVLQRVNPEERVPQALIIAPTRELCLQIAGDLADFSKYLPDIKILPVYGGSSIESQIRSLKNGVQVIVATPGRLIDLIKRGVVKLEKVNTVILDEADEMLNMGFLDDIDEILSHVPDNRKMLMFSATMPKEIAGIARKYMKDPVEFVAGNRNEASKNVRHIYYMVKAHDKYLALKRVVDNSPNIYGIIFCRTKKETQEIADKLINDGYNADCLHGDLSQSQRDLAMKKFRDHVTQLLVATDVAARGLDVDDLTHVINYGLPDDPATYTHRSGRTGRANKTGVSVAIIHSREKGKLREIEKRIGKTFEYMKVPTPEHIIEKQLYNLADRLEKVEVDEKEIAKYLPGVSKKLEWLSESDLLKRVLSLEFNRLLAYYRNMPDIDLNASGKDRDRNDREKGERRKGDARKNKDRRTAESGYERLMVDIGKGSGFFPGNLMELVNKNVPGDKPEIGRIDLLPDYTLFDVRKEDARRVLDALRHAEFYGQPVSAEIATDRDYAADARKKGKRKGAPKDKAGKGERGEKGKKGDKKDRGSKKGEKKGASKRVSYGGDPFALESAGKKPKKEKKSKAERQEKKAKYNGNYDIFIK